MMDPVAALAVHTPKTKAFAISQTQAVIVYSPYPDSQDTSVCILGFGTSISVVGRKQIEVLREALDYALGGTK